MAAGGKSSFHSGPATSSIAAGRMAEVTSSANRFSASVQSWSRQATIAVCAGRGLVRNVIWVITPKVPNEPVRSLQKS